MSPLLSVVVLTASPGDLAAVQGLLKGLPVELLSLAQALGSAAPKVVRDAATIEANALKVAEDVAAHAMMVTLAFDHGLEVVALGGRPGGRSCRFSHEGATDAENNAALLRHMAELSQPAERVAHFRSCVALADPWSPKPPLVVEGICEGSIAHKPTGVGGFGYDPLFVVAGYDRSMAELSESERREVSHLNKALRALEPHLLGLAERRLAEASEVLDAPASRP